MKIQHDGDGKLFYIEDGKVHWITECDIACGDAVATAFTNLTNQVKVPTLKSIDDFENWCGENGINYGKSQAIYAWFADQLKEESK